MIPVLIGGAELPAATELPNDLQGLVHRQAVVLHDETWHQDVEGLVRSLRGQPAVPAGPWRRWLVPAGVVAALIVLVGLGAAMGWWDRAPAMDRTPATRLASERRSCPARLPRAPAGVRSRSTTTPLAQRTSRMARWSSR